MEVRRGKLRKDDFNRLAMSLAFHFGESSVEDVHNWPAERFDEWARYAYAIGGATPLTAEIAVFAMLRIALWQGTWVKDQRPLQFKDVFLPLVEEEETPKEQTPEQIIGLLKAFASGQSTFKTRNSHNGG